MMKYFLPLLACTVLCTLAACEKDYLHKTDCEALNQAFVDRDEAVAGEQIDALSQDLSPVPTQSDPLGHAGNLQTLIDRLNDQCDDFSVSLLCYACIETLPLQSEILIELDSAGMAIERVMDIWTPEDDRLAFADFH